MERASRASSRQNRLIGVAAIFVGAVLALFELVRAPYLFVGTVIVLAVVWPMLRRRATNSSRVKKQVTVAAIVTGGFWICTTAALGFAGSGDSGSAGEVASLVSVNPWAAEMSARELMAHGIVTTFGLALLAHGVLLVTKKESHRRRRTAGRANNHCVSGVATQPVD